MTRYQLLSTERARLLRLQAEAKARHTRSGLDQAIREITTEMLRLSIRKRRAS